MELWKTVSPSDGKPWLRLAFLSGNLTAITGSVVPQVTSWTMASIDYSSNCCASKREKASVTEKSIRKYPLAGSKMINLGSTCQKIHSATVKNTKTAFKFPKDFPVLA